jgi:uncharacterized protein YbaR (Trm112 family)
MADGNHQNQPSYPTFICPSCKQTGDEVTVYREDSAFVCSECQRIYPIVDEVVFLFEHGKLAQLYPDVFRLCVSRQTQAG